MSDTFVTLWSPLYAYVQEISQAKILEWIAISFSRKSSWLRDWTHESCLAGRFFTTEPPRKPDHAIHFIIHNNYLPPQALAPHWLAAVPRLHPALCWLGLLPCCPLLSPNLAHSHSLASLNCHKCFLQPASHHNPVSVLFISPFIPFPGLVMFDGILFTFLLFIIALSP